jgi:hypothetical protein
MFEGGTSMVMWNEKWYTTQHVTHKVGGLSLLDMQVSVTLTGQCCTQQQPPATHRHTWRAAAAAAFAATISTRRLPRRSVAPAELSTFDAIHIQPVARPAIHQGADHHMVPLTILKVDQVGV